MKKTVLAITMFSLQLIADEGAPEQAIDQQIAWGNSRQQQVKQEPKVEWTKTFCNNEGTFKIEGEYLYWSTNFNLPYTIAGSQSKPQTQVGNDTFTTATGTLSAVRTPLKWSSGGRGTLGYHSKCDQLDVQAIYTYYQNKSESAQNGTSTTYFKAFTTGQEHLKLTYNVGDLELGKTFYSDTTKVLLRPFIALRAGWLDQDNSANYTGIDAVSLMTGTVNVPTASSLVIDQDVWCVGPRVGIDMSWLRFGGLSIMVDFSTALLYGKAHQKMTVHTNSADANGQQTGIDYQSSSYAARDKFMVLCPQLQGFIGLQWERCLKNHRSVKLFAGWEANFWWEVSNVLFLDRPLSMQGLTAGLSFNL